MSVEQKEDLVIDSDNDNENEEESDAELFEQDVSIADLFQTFFAGSNEENVVDVLVEIKKSLETQNKILMKIVNKLPSA